MKLAICWLCLLVALLVAPAGAFAAVGAREISQACVAAGCFEGDAPGFPITTEIVCSEQGFNGGGMIANPRSVVKNGTIRGIRSYGIRAEPSVHVENAGGVSIGTNVCGTDTICP